MNEPMICPVCKASNNREYYQGCLGTEEDYYCCDKCGYTHHMAYSSYSYGFSDFCLTNDDLKERKRVRELNVEKVNEIKSKYGYSEYIDML